uniref:Transmembrane protein n=1 Tax=Solanum tuberosum TaxID=4113 RepID=M0ZRD3_SOLTU
MASNYFVSRSGLNLIALVISVMFISNASVIPCTEAGLINHRELYQKPKCPPCLCCQSTVPPPPCCYCACYVTQSHNNNNP